MIDMLKEQAWWVYELPGGIIYVPAASEADARRSLAVTMYNGAPVDSYPFVASRWTSRAAIVHSILGRPVMPGQPEGVKP